MYKKSINSDAETFKKCLEAIKSELDSGEEPNNIPSKLNNQFQEKEVSSLLETIPKIQETYKPNNVLKWHRIFLVLGLIFLTYNHILLILGPHFGEFLGFDFSSKDLNLGLYRLYSALWTLAFLGALYNSFRESNWGYLFSLGVSILFFNTFNSFVYLEFGSFVAIIPPLLSIPLIITGYILYFKQKRGHLLWLKQRIDKHFDTQNFIEQINQANSIITSSRS